MRPLARLLRSAAVTRCASTSPTPAPAPTLICPAPPPAGFFQADGSRGTVEWDRRTPPMVWHPDYSVPWPSNHRFAMWKFDDLRLECVRSGLVPSERAFFSPRDEAGDEELDAAILAAHDATYVADVTTGTLEATLWRRVGFVQAPDHARLMRRTRLEVAGTLAAADLARTHGLCAHLAGGTHHAHRRYGAGYTIFNDLAVAALDHARRRLGPVVVVDLDVHQGGGTAEILAGERGITTWSMHCAENYPSASTKVLAALDDVLPRLLDDVAPTLVLFDAGADAHAVDGLGHLELTDAGVRNRDGRACADRGIPASRSSAAATTATGNVGAAARVVCWSAATIWRDYDLRSRGGA
ncbi:protein deacetylase [Aureococcus anophagefferens]|nr:protein deacetylase [Aureococcus anophagefferens]